MACCWPRTARRWDGVLDGSLQHGFVQVVTAPLAGFPVDVKPGGGEDPLPCPFPWGSRIFGANCRRQRHGATASGQSGTMLGFDASQMVAQRNVQRDWQDCDAIFHSLAVSVDQFG